MFSLENGSEIETVPNVSEFLEVPLKYGMMPVP
jgi:hypothetical protein